VKKKFDDQDAKKLREIYISRIEEIDPNKDSALALSGGTDSITVLFAMMETGRKPECYTFYMNGIVSRDLISSRHACEYFGLNLHEVCVPSDVDSIYRDVKRVIPYCEKVKKTIIQCMTPWLYIYPAMEQHTIITGMGGDDYFGTQRKVQVAYHNLGDEGIIDLRKYFGDDLNFSGANIERFARVYGKENIDFYGSKEIEQFLLGFTFECMNKPVPKYPSIAAFMDYYRKEPFYRDQTDHSYQINSGLRECHERLLNSNYNRNGKKAIIGLYNEISRGI